MNGFAPNDPVMPRMQTAPSPAAPPLAQASATRGGRPGRLADVDMRANGFDTIRLIAAIAVILSHAFPLTGATEPLEWASGGQITIGALAVSIFFLISGYLIPASLDRGSLARYATKRAMRIMPALVAAVLVCVAALGPLVTKLSIGAYFGDPATWRFLGHAVFLPVGFDLPGVFTAQPLSAVNGSLWSLKYEVACYILVPIAFAFGALRRVVVVLGWLASFAIAWAIPEGTGGVFYFLDLFAQLYRYFGTGMLLYLFADRIPLRRDWALWAVIACGFAILTPFFAEAMATLGAYAIVYFAYHCPQWFRDVTARGDISYGVYVYAFPIQQLFVPLSLGGILGALAAPWAVNFLIALPLSLLAGLVSWVAIEKPFLLLGRSRRPVRPSLA
ncbi:acyltransferase family protein [Erythrobacter sp.]|jgi:peptidoglycan/LPS O-acetylase OafA/YrhL|uniref:acyltransferase family protein n=1 Tax=Erythrobacter sp. TaxID=1042 RepID=UPI002EA019BB|nr:acyltransferase [Erythrobacter sp.]